ncbi:DUF4357 domain-containing protein [Fusobacterium sp.]|uniref:DUF4357 domain-containing protein n=1 Tax=Fusobacterium sp. TaxID=68766 RepID=UPI00396C3BF3
MKASEKKIVSLFAETNTFFNIPVYQRNYNWEEKHCRQLFDDILEIGRDEKIPSHFIGSIVYIHNGVYTTGDKDLDIIDGQQRMTTLTLLFMVLYKELKKSNSMKSSQIYDQYLVNKYTEREIKLKLSLPEENLEILNGLLQEDNEKILEDYKDRNLVKNYLFFRHKLGNFSDEDLNLFINGIEKLLCVDVALERGKDDPQKIFESLNSTGLDLSQADLVRNFILMDLDKKEQERIYKKIWIPIENNCKLSDGAKIKNYVSEFIRDFLTLKSNNIPSKPKVFEEFKKFYVGNLEEKLKELLECSTEYSCILDPKLEKDKSISVHLEYLKLLDQTVVNPFLIGILREYREKNISKDELINIVELLQSFLWRRYITGEKTNALNSLFKGMYSKLKKSGTWYETLEGILMNQVFPNDEELKGALKMKPLYKDKDRLFYVLRRLETYNHNETIDFDNNKITIEHIFPQKPNASWKKSYSEDELEQMTAVRDTISNLTLTGSNSNLSNKAFLDKRDEPSHGYKDSKLFLNSYLAGIDRWDMLHMERRFEILFENIVKIWKKPEEKKEVDVGKMTFYIKGTLTSGTGKLLPNNRFELLKGSTIIKNMYESASLTNKKILNELKEKDLIDEEENWYVLKENYKMSSPSGAAKLILGRAANGWTEWTTFNGDTLDTYRKKDK